MRTKKTKLQRLNTRGPKIGQCNICGELARLTEDHTPPKCCGLGTPVELHNLRDKISAGNEQWEQPRHFQAGVTFRSLCKRCNTDLLGVKYDPALGSFSAQVRSLADSPIFLPDAVKVTIAPQAVMRSVIGHLCAQGIERYEKGIYTEPIRDYLLDPALPLPPQVRMYYWLYPYRSQVLVRDAARIERLGSGRGGIAFWLMKFYPLAFMVTLNESQRLYRIDDFDRFANISFAQQVPVRLSLRPLLPCRWPERPEGTAAVLYGPQATVADPLHRRANLVSNSQPDKSLRIKGRE